MSTSNTLFNFNIHQLYTSISNYLNNPIMHKIDEKTFGIKIRHSFKDNIFIVCKCKNKIDKNSISLNQLYWRSLQIRFTSNDLTSKIKELPYTELKYDISVKPFLHNVKIKNNEIIDGYPEFGVLMIDKEISKIDNLYDALKTQNCLIHCKS